MHTEASSTDTNPFVLRPLAKPLTAVAAGPTQKVEGIIPETREDVNTYVDRHNHPLIVDILEVTSLYSHEEYRPLADSIDKFILSELESRGMEKTERAYRRVYEEMLKETGLDDLTEFDKKLDKLSDYSSVITKQKLLDRLKRELGINDRS